MGAGAQFKALWSVRGLEKFGHVSEGFCVWRYATKLGGETMTEVDAKGRLRSSYQIHERGINSKKEYRDVSAHGPMQDAAQAP